MWPFFFYEWQIWKSQRIRHIPPPLHLPNGLAFFCLVACRKCHMIGQFEFSAKSAEVFLHRQQKLCFIPKKKSSGFRYSFLAIVHQRMRTFIYNVQCHNVTKKNGISLIFYWIYENFVDICLEIKLWILKINFVDCFC